MMDAMSWCSYDGSLEENETEREEHTFFYQCEIEEIRQETIRFARREEEDGVDGWWVGWWGDALQHYAQPCDGHKPGPTFSALM